MGPNALITCEGNVAYETETNLTHDSGPETEGDNLNRSYELVY